MKIVDVRITGLTGGTVDGGWPQGNKPEEDLNTILEVLTDEGPIGVGSAMTSKALVTAAVNLLRPHLIGERADEPARVSEKLRQAMFWQGRGGAACSAAVIDSASSRMARSSSTSRGRCARRYSKPWRAVSGRSSWVGVPSAGATVAPMNCSSKRPGRQSDPMSS
jgi:hypothetical protein